MLRNPQALTALTSKSLSRAGQHGLTGLINDTGLIAPNGDIDDDINLSMRVNACQRVSVDEFDVCITRSNFLMRANACQFVPIRVHACHAKPHGWHRP